MSTGGKRSTSRRKSRSRSKIRRSNHRPKTLKTKSRHDSAFPLKTPTIGPHTAQSTTPLKTHASSLFSHLAAFPFRRLADFRPRTWELRILALALFFVSHAVIAGPPVVTATKDDATAATTKKNP